MKVEHLCLASRSFIGVTLCALAARSLCRRRRWAGLSDGAGDSGERPADGKALITCICLRELPSRAPRESWLARRRRPEVGWLSGSGVPFFPHHDRNCHPWRYFLLGCGGGCCCSRRTRATTVRAHTLLVGAKSCCASRRFLCFQDGGSLLLGRRGFRKPCAVRGALAAQRRPRHAIPRCCPRRPSAASSIVIPRSSASLTFATVLVTSTLMCLLCAVPLASADERDLRSYIFDMSGLCQANDYNITDANGHTYAFQSAFSALVRRRADVRVLTQSCVEDQSAGTRTSSALRRGRSSTTADRSCSTGATRRAVRPAQTR